MLVAQCTGTCKAIGNFARAPRDEIKFSSLRLDGSMISARKRIQQYDIYIICRYFYIVKWVPA